MSHFLANPTTHRGPALQEVEGKTRRAGEGRGCQLLITSFQLPPT